PVVVEAHALADVARGADQSLDRRILALGLQLVDAGRRHAVLFGFDQAEQRPLDDVVELPVAAPHQRAERLLGDRLGEDHVVVLVRRLQPRRRQPRDVGREHVAAAREERLLDLLQLVDHHRTERHLLGAEVVAQVQLGGRARLHADRRAVELRRALDVGRLLHHEALAVVEDRAGEHRAERRVAARGPGGVARQDVDFARLQHREAVLRVGGHELDLVRVAQDDRRDGAAEVDVDAGPLALAVRRREADQAGIDAATQRTSLFDRVQRRAGRRDGRREQRAGRQQGGDAGYRHVGSPFVSITGVYAQGATRLKAALAGYGKARGPGVSRVFPVSVPWFS